VDVTVTGRPLPHVDCGHAGSGAHSQLKVVQIGTLHAFSCGLHATLQP
jgi:hypothetical protein